VKVVNVPGGENLSAIDNKVAVIAEALGKTPAGDALRQQLQQQIAPFQRSRLPSGCCLFSATAE
jgi:ABC-type hemin transport system substrate-binding protein